MSDAISLEGVSVESLRLTGEDVLVKPAPMEEKRASGLYVPNAAPEAFVGGVFYGEVVKVGPGRRANTPTTAQVREAVRRASISYQEITGYMASAPVAGPVSPESIPSAFTPKSPEDALADLTIHYLGDPDRIVPMPWKPGDRVVCRQGYGPEVILREGTFHLIGRGNADYGHGIIAAWDAAHVHCWHLEIQNRDERVARCACGEVNRSLETHLPSCAACPPGERLAEAVLGGDVYSAKHGNNVGPGFYEMRPEEDR